MLFSLVICFLCKLTQNLKNIKQDLTSFCKNRAFFKLRLKEQNKKAKILITYHILNINMFQI